MYLPSIILAVDGTAMVFRSYGGGWVLPEESSTSLEGAWRVTKMALRGALLYNMDIKSHAMFRLSLACSG